MIARRSPYGPTWHVTADGDQTSRLTTTDGRNVSHVAIWTDNDRMTFSIDADVWFAEGGRCREYLTPIKFRKFERALAWAQANLAA
jgi:hypothetical protein